MSGAESGWIAAEEFADFVIGDDMKFFNAFQLTVLFAGLPILINWLRTAEFWCSGAAFWVALVAYLVLFIVTIVAYVELLGKT